MHDDESRHPLVWITKAYGINPAHIVLVFHGNDDHVEIAFVGGVSKKLSDAELTPEGRALLLPSTHRLRHRDDELATRHA